MESGSIVQFLEDKNILVTGATGFLAKLFVEKVLRVQPNVKKLYLLLRASTDAKSAAQRFQNEVVGKDLFRVLKEKWGGRYSRFVSEKVVPIAGDISLQDLGINDSDLKNKLFSQIDAIINLAATTKFDERYDVALSINTMGAKNVVNFAKRCSNLKVLVHVSTAYVCGERGGLIEEKAFNVGDTLNGGSGLDIDAEMKMAQQSLHQLMAMGDTQEATSSAMKDLGLIRARKYGWPNTYVFTKAMGEMLVGELKDNLPTVILRPTIVASTYKEPFPGWVEGVRTIDSLIATYAKGRLKCFTYDSKTIMDVVPADMVVNSIIAAMAAHSGDQHCLEIYQVGSSMRNPIHYSDLREYVTLYFSEHPWKNKQGKPVIVADVTILNTMESFRRYMAFRYLLPLKGLEVANAALCQYLRGTCIDLRRKINIVMRLIDLYGPYIFFQGVFDDMNTEKLGRAIRERSGTEADMFYFDPKIINWPNYFLNAHIPGVVKYALIN